MDAPTNSLIATAVICGLSYLVYRFKDVGRREAGLPPGPPTSPLLGNLLVFPKGFAYIKFTEWAKEYGEIVSVKLGSGTVIILSSAAAVRDVLEKKSANTSDRPQMFLANFVTGGKNFFFEPSNSDIWRNCRRTVHQLLTPQTSVEHLPIQVAESTQLMFDLLTTAEAHPFSSLKRYSSSVITSVLFGQRSPRLSDPIATKTWKFMDVWGASLTPGNHPPLDFLPILQWLPGAWRKDAKMVRDAMRDLHFGLLEEVEKNVREGKGNGCWMELVLPRAQDLGLDREAIGFMGGALLEAGAETTTSVLKCFLLAMVAHPDVVKKAQSAIDEVVGVDRMPTLTDWERLPYLEAILQEISRWRPTLPLGFFHQASEEETYKEYRIPKGAVIFQNNWAFLHDPNMYDDPESFNPDRFLKNEFGLAHPELVEEYRNTYTFGAGRRICPGIHIAMNSLRINVLNLLWGFDFLKGLDAEGREIEPDVWAFGSSTSISPAKLDCRIVPRSERHAELIKEEFLAAAQVFGGFEHQLGDEDRDWVRGVRAAVQKDLRR